MPKSNIELLKEVAKRLGPLLQEVVFVGGCATALLMTDAAGAEVRSTLDVDVIAEIASYADYAAFSERLRNLGFQEDTSKGAPICRWLFDDLILDVMPVEAKVFGFANRWYRGAMGSANTIGFHQRSYSWPWLWGSPSSSEGRSPLGHVSGRDLGHMDALLHGFAARRREPRGSK